MSMIITDDCINCSACAVECPTEAIYEPGISYEVKEKFYKPISNEHFFIVTDLCNRCEGFEEFKCVLICPMDAIRATHNFDSDIWKS
ncbi:MULTISPECIES: 4Fe-4S binding protein [unclassified Melioribacter]|uniref:4Fe-4S binding protein n=1 Tax=unclassified Melioribacter TaxID=2627329 RepID=UPI003BE3B066